MIEDQLRQQILDLLTEDHYGLWELTGLPGAPPVANLIRVLGMMVRDGLVEIHVESKFASEERVMSEDEARRAIKKRAYWEWSAPQSADHLRAAATRAGADWYSARRRSPA